MPEPLTREELLAKANKPAEDSLKMHPFYKGKISITSKCVVRSVADFAVWYTPGVAAVCRDIQAHPEKVYEHTNKGNMVAVISDGTRVLGLGDIGPEAGIPVMEGKALIFKYLGGVDAVPICLDTKDPDEIIRTVKILQPSFGGINLEDISMPKCFRILDTLRKECRIPVWHDDQQGTAAVTVAGLINALKVVGKAPDQVKVAMVGAGAANIRIAHLIIKAGVDPKKIIMCDSKGTLHAGRTELKEAFPEKWEMCELTNGESLVGDIPAAMKGADVLIALSTPGPDVIKKEWVASMNKDSIVFCCANPIPEIWPWDAKEAGARVVATGRSDFANQVNNSMGFPAIFRGTLDVGATTITDEMCLEAARSLAEFAEKNKGISEDYVIPTMDEWEVFPYEATAVGMKAIEQGIAKHTYTRDELYAIASKTIKHARDEIDLLMREGIIAPAPEGL
ncbi:malate dehydrogenase [Candidatus Wirthbacteria bacterium CG2_30_54_11]|uniref:Malate dehydrogenase n=1 Tax=Candidatus Wirthbacteria bacterium CG2_30_54_11 TaxID=1817892 RepID=A0A1J5ILZ5_9BACT|nr:MAG: malate dehydrogenase [Candidatus Wirthbacteria bacterium CG2_30_54_11]